MKRLEEKVKQYDSEIEKLCNSNYQTFVDTFNELLSVREDTANLKVFFFYQACFRNEITPGKIITKLLHKETISR